jgi:hypothetical protein
VAKRWLSAHARRVSELRPVYLGDALFSCQPLAEAVLEKSRQIDTGSIRA